MSKQTDQVVVTLEVTITKPKGANYNDEEIANCIKIKTNNIDLKVKCFGVADKEPA